MRKLLIHLLMLLMLTPGLVCGGLPCMGMQKAHVATDSMAGMNMPGMPCCPDHRDCDHAAGKKINAPMFFKDCAKADLYKADAPVLKNPGLSGKIAMVAWVGTVPLHGIASGPAAVIRGPPPGWPDLAQTQPSILLSTQRFRE